ncbi:hypothetical protein CTAYLR_002143 [Chrysophaeum taylorii]|uniref:Thioredoxin domain-containing protein n=1 Tax=Chrysophaeum taylorii TaxID=2483200 RepID=A0AAD7UNZ0_9STRA|nr:hypothetical protein CTAYLR_002143 [Chrysophaeum taylorii]
MAPTCFFVLAHVATAFIGGGLGTKPLATALKFAAGDSVPLDGEFMVMADGPSPLAAKEVFEGKTVVVFGIPGALTPTCTEKQMPGYVEKADEFKSKGVDTVACLSVNDPFVMAEMSKKQDPDGKITMLADGAAAFVKAIDIGVDTGNFGGVRCQRCSMLVKDGVATIVNLEGGTGFTEISAAETLLGQL